MDILIKDRLRAKRVEKGLSRDKLAALAGVTSQLIYRAERDGKIYMTSYLKIVEVLDNYRKGSEYIPPYVSRYELLFGNDKNK
jgi:transcriptional regulator with XRE-family HTH domain